MTHPAPHSPLERSANVVPLSPQVIALHQGRMAFKRGERMPNRPSDKEFHGKWTQAACFWMGYMGERGVEYMERKRVAELLGCDDEAVEPLDYD